MHSIIVVGAGAAGLSLAYYLSHQPRDNRFHIYLVDPDTKTENDRTWSYWGAPFEFDHLVTRRWDSIILQNSDSAAHSHYTQSTIDVGNTYRCIPADRFYRECREALEHDPRFSWIRARVEHYTTTEHGVTAALNYPDGRQEEIHGDYIVDSVFGETAPFRQSFVGWEVETEADIFDPTTVTLMDFSHQSRDVKREVPLHFLYALPFSRRRALIEITTVGADQPAQDLLEHTLIAEIDRQAGGAPWNVVRREKGTIPLYLAHQPGPLDSNFRIVKLGVVSGAARPTTGYAFRSIVETSQMLAKTYGDTGQLRFVPAGQSTAAMPHLRRRPRFFDRVFMRVLQNEPDRLPSALVRLFRRNPPERVFNFLAGISTVRQEIGIIFSLPWGPFLRGVAHRRKSPVAARIDAQAQGPTTLQHQSPGVS